MRCSSRYLTLFTGLMLAAGCALAPEPPPNLVLIIVDTLRADRLGSYGHPSDPSPELDGLAARGVRFERVFTPCTWTRPSIGSMITGLSPRTLGLYREADEILADRFTTLAEILREHGYTTLGTTANPTINSYYNFQQGFDRYVDTDVVFRWMATEEGQKIRGEEGHWLPRADEIFANLLAEVERRRDGGPFYLQVNLMEVHEFHDPKVRFGAAWERLFRDEPDLRRRRYLQAVRYVSHEIDAFVQRLSAIPGWENTLFAIASDHGETLDDHPALAKPDHHGWLVYRSQSLVPWILYDTAGRLPAGRSVKQAVRLVDLLPTLLDHAGIPLSADLEGRSRLPLVADPQAGAGREGEFFVETRFRGANKIAVYSGEWEYVENRDGHAGTSARELQLGDRVENGSATDVSALHPEIVEKLAGRLREWERRNPPADPTPTGDEASEQLKQQLRSLGYLQ